MEVLEPAQGAGEEKIADLGAAVVEDERPPAAVLPDARVLVLVKGGAVEARQGELVAGEVPGDPVQDHSEAGLVGLVNEMAKVVGVTEARGGCEEAGALIAPRPVEGMFGNRQQLEMGKAQVARVRHQPLRQVAIVGPFALGAALPGTEVHLVDAHRLMFPGLRIAIAHPLFVVPGVRAGRLDPGGRLRTDLVGAGIRVRLQVQAAMLTVADLELVERLGLELWNKQLPDAAAGMHHHRVAAPVPAVEITDHRHALGVGGPHRKPHAIDAVAGDRVGAQYAVGVPVAALGEEVTVELGDVRREGPRINIL